MKICNKNIRKSAIKKEVIANIHLIFVSRPGKMSEKNDYRQDDLVFEGIKGKSRAKYKKAWKQFQYYHGETREELRALITAISSAHKTGNGINVYNNMSGNITL